MPSTPFAGSCKHTPAMDVQACMNWLSWQSQLPEPHLAETQSMNSIAFSHRHRPLNSQEHMSVSPIGTPFEANRWVVSSSTFAPSPKWPAVTFETEYVT